MKPTIKSKINRLLKFLGFNVVKAKRARVRKAGHRSHVPIEDAKTGPDSWDLKEGQTHFYNDGCPGGHLGETGQPHSDNKTSGPSS